MNKQRYRSHYSARDMNTDHRGINKASLLLPGEGQDEGSTIMQLFFIYPLTPTLSLRERGLTGQQ